MKQKSWIRHIRYLYLGHSEHIHGVSRKTKKAFIGKKMSRVKLRKRLAAVVVTQNKYPNPASISDAFCPRCGCERTRTTGNMADYPEVWVQEFCLRCGFLVGMADNGPWQYALEYPKYNYELD